MTVQHWPDIFKLREVDTGLVVILSAGLIPPLDMGLERGQHADRQKA